MPTADNPSSLTLSLPEAFALACKSSGPLSVRAVHRATGVEQHNVVQSPFVFIGRSPASGIRLDDISVSQGHAYLQIIEGVPYCLDLGSRSGVIWPDGTQGCGWVARDQVLRIGVFDVSVDGSEGPQSDYHPDSNHDSLPVLTQAAAEIHPAANGAQELYSFDRPITLVGRHPSCDLRLIDDSIGYFQCALVNTADGIWFVDVMTRKGAILNGRGSRLARVRDGDLLEIGKRSLLFRVGIHHEKRLAVRETALAKSMIDPVAAISAAVSESLAGALVPVGEMMKQFQQCYLTMAQMFVSMQHEHSALVGEQMRQIQELASELRELRTEVRKEMAAQVHQAGPKPAPQSMPFAAETETSPTGKPAEPQRQPSIPAPTGAEGQALSDAHAWFMNRLTGKTQGSSTKS